MPSTPGKGRTPRRTDALSKDVVVAAATQLLDEHGERGFTFKLLTERLHTGAGAVYWHVANKDELVRLCADRVLGDALTPTPQSDQNPQTQLRTLALAVYDALDPHPWAASYVTVHPALNNTLRLLDRIGTLLTRTPLPENRRFLVATALFNYVTGVTAQESVRATTVGMDTNRDTVFAAYARHWEALDPKTFPYLTGAADDLRGHDDRDQFRTGLDLLLDGLHHQLTTGTR
ncbi:TetR/AcrR family transcriptional regulator [Micromonosporaceae bacterium Da 78-11]